ncbi:DUF177 domain-containing protein [Gemmobacter sp.]|uniref:YceD family protein n=1 Tax=Gemmobacter sp. TaxID=1898957 RepID=UPI002AFF883B|nr:DUF177 domain-containing protein [Gemmobacter sp.]
MTDHSATRIRTADLTGNRRRPFDLKPGAEGLAALAADLGLLSLMRLRFVGELRPQGRSDVKLEARLLAAGDQACVVTLAPVPFVLEVPVDRLYVAGMIDPEGDEVEMPEDDSREPLPETVDLEAVMAEALALALPDYPRAPGAELGQAVFAEPGTAPLTDEALRPFAGLAALKGKLDG